MASAAPEKMNQQKNSCGVCEKALGEMLFKKGIVNYVYITDVSGDCGFKAGL